MYPTPHDLPITFPDPQHMTFLACNPTYYSQTVNATAAAADSSLISTTAIEPRETLTEHDPDIAFYEDIFDNGIAYRTAEIPFPERYMSEVFPHTQRKHISIINQGFVIGLALGASDQPLYYYLEPDHLQVVMEAAHRLSFANTINRLIIPTKDVATDLATGYRTYEVDVVLGIRTFALIVEVLPMVVSALALVLLFLSRRRESRLYADPASISSILSLASWNKNILEDFKGCDSADEKELNHLLRDTQFHFKKGSGGIILQRQAQGVCQGVLVVPLMLSQHQCGPWNSASPSEALS